MNRILRKFFNSSMLLVALTLPAAMPSIAGPPDAEPSAVRVGGDVKPPVKTKDVKPIYPSTARQTHAQGVVILEVTIGVDGKVKSTRVLKSLKLFDDAAIDAVKQWEYKPTMIEGKATPVILTTSVNFKLD